MQQRLTVQEYMSQLPNSIDADATLNEIVSTIHKEGIHYLPVMENGKLVGVIFQSIADEAVSLEMADEMTARDVMLQHPFTVEPRTPLDTVSMEMATHKLEYVIVQENGKVLGIFTSQDALRALGETLQSHYRSKAA